MVRRIQFRTPFRVIAFVTVALLAACSMRPQHEFDPAVNFGDFQQWNWRMPDYGEGGLSDPILDSELLGKRVEAAVTRSLEGRGFTRDGDAADFVVTYHTSKDFELYDRGPSFSIGIFHGWDHFHTGVGYDTRRTMSKQGVLIIDIIDADSNELVWRGWRKLPLAQEYFTAEQVGEAVDSILAAFPPPNQPAS